MLASAAGQYKDRHIYATGGNDNTVGIWDLTEVSLNQDQLSSINNGMDNSSLDTSRAVADSSRRDGQLAGEVGRFQDCLGQSEIRRRM